MTAQCLLANAQFGICYFNKNVRRPCPLCAPCSNTGCHTTLFVLFIRLQLKPSCPMPPQHGGGLRIVPTVGAKRLSYAGLLLSNTVKCRPPPSLVFARRRMINCSTKFFTMRDIYFPHSSLQEEVNIILSVNAVAIFRCLLARQPSRTITF
jgi:hypothetical protein